VRGPRRNRDAAAGAGDDATAALVQAFEALLPATTTLVSHHFTRALLEAAVERIEHVDTPGNRVPHESAPAEPESPSAVPVGPVSVEAGP
jgi:hypothetical protein